MTVFGPRCLLKASKSLPRAPRSLPRASQEPSQSPQEAFHSLQESPIRPPRGFQEPALQTFLHSCHAPQSYCCIHSRRRGMYWLAVLQWLKYASTAHDHCSNLLCRPFYFLWQKTRHQRQRIHAGTVADQRASGHGYIYIYIIKTTTFFYMIFNCILTYFKCIFNVLFIIYYYY